MPRKRKVETGHEKVTPLSLPEVQLCVANSIDGDIVDEESIQRALQGYQLILQGSLRDSCGETTKEVTGHAGYYPNVMRGVANLFGIEKRDDDKNRVLRGVYLSDESEYEGEESQVAEILNRASKRRATTQAEGAHNSDVRKNSNSLKLNSVFPPHPLINNGEKEAPSPDCLSPADTASHPDRIVTEQVKHSNRNNEEGDTSTPATDNIQNATQLSPDCDITYDHRARDTPQATLNTDVDVLVTSTLCEPVQNIPFNRYKGKNTTEPFIVEVPRASSTPASDENAGRSITRTMEQGKLSASLSRSDHGNLGVMSPLRSDQNEAITSTVREAALLPQNMGTAQKHDDDGANDTMVRTEKTVLSSPKTPQNRTPSFYEGDGKVVDILVDATPPEYSLKDVKNDINQEFLTSFISTECKLAENTRIFSHFEAVSELERRILPGTWLASNKKLQLYDFKSAESSFVFCMIRRFKGKWGEKDEGFQWQLVIFIDTKRYCNYLRDNDENTEHSLFWKPSVFLFDSTQTGVSSEVVLCCRNFYVGVLRAFLAGYKRQSRLPKQSLDRLKTLVNTLSSHIIHVEMPAQPGLKYSGMYALNNLKHLFATENNKEMFDVDEKVTKDNTETKTFRIGAGKIKSTLKVKITKFDMTTAYAEELFG